ncbi:MAG TPA: ABC transporter permease [Mycobacteriales bacterium]|nr:ABC transporter permease [Mycobacteriales bacterium]
MGEFIGLSIAGLSLGAIYAIAACGLVVTYTTSGVFNFAHGAIGMFMAYVYWELRIHQHWAGPWALIMTLLIIAPVLGLIIRWALVQFVNVNDTGLMLVVTLAVLVALMGLAFTIWLPTQGRFLPVFFGPDAHISVDGQRVSYEELIAIGLAAALAVALRLFFFRTNIGISMRAVVDDRPLMGLAGGSSKLLDSLSWVIGAALGALAGILTATTYSLDVINLTLLVLNSFAAAMLGRLRNLPLTFLGAIMLGLAEAYVTGYVRLTGTLAHLRPVLPTLFLFAVLLFLPSVRLRAGRPAVAAAIRVPTALGSLRNGVVIVIAALIAAPMLSGTNLTAIEAGVALAIGALSIVLLSGYGGQVSLAQYTFFGFGAFIYYKTAGHGGSAIGLLAAAGAGAVLGVVVALPALRLRGLELALSTLAFGQLAYYMFFLQNGVMGRGDITIPRLHVPGLNLNNDRTNLVFLAVVFALLSSALLWVRRGTAGRVLNATKDSEAAVATIGLSIRVTKIALFSASTALACFGGALYGSTTKAVTSDNFQYIQSLFIVLIVYLWGVSTPGAALAGALSLAISPLTAVHLSPRFQSLTYLMTGFGALVLVLFPNGIIPTASGFFHRQWARMREPRPPLVTLGPIEPLYAQQQAS